MKKSEFAIQYADLFLKVYFSFSSHKDGLIFTFQGVL